MTPEQQSQFDAIKAKYNYKPTTPAAQATDWFAATAPKPASPTFSSVAGAIGEKFNERADKVGGILNSNQNPVSKTLQAVGQGFGAVNDSIGEVVTSTIKPEILQNVGQHLAPLVEKAKETPAGQGIINWWDTLKKDHPETAANLEATGNIGLLLSNALGVGAGAKGAQVGVSVAKDSIPELTAPLTEKATELASEVKNTVAHPVQSTKNALSGTAEAIAKKIPPEMQQKAIQSLASDYEQYASATKAGVKNLGKMDARTEALNKAGTTGKPASQVLAESKIIPKSEGTKLRTLQQADQLREDITPLNEALGNAIKEARFSTPPSSLDSLEETALARAMAQRIPEGDRNALMKGIQDEFNLLRKKYGDSMTIQEMYDTKPAYWGGTKFDSTKPFQGDSYYQVGKSLQKGIEDSATKAGYEDVAQLNREIGDRLEAAKFLQSLDGQTVKYGRLGKYVFMGIGASLGTGITGKVLGALGGEVVGQLLMDVSVASPVKRLILRSIEKKSPEAYQTTVKWLAEQEKLRDIRPRLEAPAPLGSDKNPIVPAAPTTFEKGVPNPDHSPIDNALPGQSLPNNLSTTNAIPNAASVSNMEETIPQATKEAMPLPAEPTVLPSDNPTMLDKAKGVFNTIKTQGNRGFVAIPGLGGKYPKQVNAFLKKEPPPQLLDKLKEFIDAQRRGVIPEEYKSYKNPKSTFSADLRDDLAEHGVNSNTFKNDGQLADFAEEVTKAADIAPVPQPRQPNGLYDFKKKP